jgi:hypothetical protein
LGARLRDKGTQGSLWQRHSTLKNKKLMVAENRPFRLDFDDVHTNPVARMDFFR